MALSEQQLRLLDFLKEYVSGKEYEDGDIVGIVLCCRKQDEIDRLIKYCHEHPQAEMWEVLKEAVNISSIKQKIIFKD